MNVRFLELKNKGKDQPVILKVVAVAFDSFSVESSIYSPNEVSQC